MDVSQLEYIHLMKYQENNGGIHYMTIGEESQRYGASDSGLLDGE